MNKLKLNRILTFLPVMLILICSVALDVFAAEIDTEAFDSNESGTILINYRYNETPLDDVEFKVYHITAYDEDDNQILLEDYQSIEVDFDLLSDTEYWLQFRDNLENYINYEMISPETIFYTDGYGQYKLEDLELGIYLIKAETLSEDSQVVFSEPILIQVGHYDDSDEKWIYYYDVQPKISVINYESPNLTITKVWENIEDELVIPDEIEIELHCNGELYDVVTLSEENMWTYTVYNVDPTLCWGIAEITECEGFQVDYSRDVFEITVTNTYVEEPEEEEPTVEPEEEEPTVEPEEEAPTVEPEEELPQTGSTLYLASGFAGIGLIFLMLGICFRYRVGYREDDKKESK